jgi:hypothetical protein
MRARRRFPEERGAGDVDMHAIYHLWRSIIIHCTAEELDEDEAQSAGGALCRVRTQQAKSSRRSCGGACTTPRSIHASIAGGGSIPSPMSNRDVFGGGGDRDDVRCQGVTASCLVCARESLRNLDRTRARTCGAIFRSAYACYLHSRGGI